MFQILVILLKKKKTVTCDISAVFTAHETGFSSDVEVIGLISILLNDEKMTKDLKDNKEDSLFEILKKMNKEFMN